MEESRGRARQVWLFVLVCALHGVLAWLMLTGSRVMALRTQARGFELIVISPSTASSPVETRLTASPIGPAAPPGSGRVGRDESRRRLRPQQRPAMPPYEALADPHGAAAASSQANAIAPPIDWNAELARAGRAASGIEPHPAAKDFGFPARSPTTADYPQFDWDYARTHRVESIPEGGMVIHLNDNCVLLLAPLPFPICSPFKKKANGELFKHMRDPDKPGDPRVP